MYIHIGLRVKDLQKAKQLYTAILAPLGHVPGPSGEGYAGFGPKDAPALWLHGTKNGGGAPGLRTDYAPNHYAAFLLDPDGNNV